jgi:hypothetical protein
MDDQEPPTTTWRKRWAASKGSLAVIFGAVTVALIITVVLQAVEILQPHTKVLWGSLSEALAAIGTLLAVGVALWQSVVIRRQAKDDATEGADRFKAEIEAANERTIQEVEAAERRSQRELDAAAKRHEAELETQREVARTQRVHLSEQEFKVAMTRVARAASSFTHELATLVSETQRIVALPTRQERDDEIKPIARRMNLASHALTIEISGAHMLTNNDQLHTALDPILEAGVAATLSANEYENTVIMAGETPNAVPVYMAMEEMNRVVGDASRLAGRLLVTGWD